MKYWGGFMIVLGVPMGADKRRGETWIEKWATNFRNNK